METEFPGFNVLIEMGFTPMKLTEITETTVDVIRFKETIKELSKFYRSGIDIPTVQLYLYRECGVVYTRIDAERIFDYLLHLNFIRKTRKPLGLNKATGIINSEIKILYAISDFYALTDNSNEEVIKEHD